jgi:signal transduction histidine kinase
VLYSASLAGWLYEPETPALVREIDPEAGWIAIELDSAVTQQRILPDLARRYFMGVDGLDYLIAVVSEAREVIYTSDPGFGEGEVTDADGRMDVFGRATAKRYGSPIYVFHKLSETAVLSGLVSIGTSWFPLVGSTDNGWQLIVRHRRGGALGAFVAEMHRRDLAISFTVLFLLVVSVAMLIVTSLRANRLAKLQVDFVTAVSHELRSPLTIINSAAENIVHGVVAGKEQMAQYGSVIEGQARRLSRLVEEILLFAATRENRHRYESRPLEVAAIVDATLAATADLLEASQFTVERDIPAQLPQVRGDLAALSQCLQNLITNALKYSGGQRWIGIRANIGDGANGKEVRIRVADRGVGIAASDLPHIFEPFYRTSSATASRIHGTGLGLSLAKNIAEAMNGRLTVESQPGRGTAFTLHLPCDSPQPNPKGEELGVSARREERRGAGKLEIRNSRFEI